MTTGTSFPDGVERRHVERRSVFYRHASPAALIVLALLMAAALLGIFGGGKDRPLRVESEDAVMTVSMPREMRNGIFFEMRITVTAKRDIADATIAVAPALWRDMTVNTTIPAASEEDADGGRFRFHYGALDAGERLQIKFDGQINPPLFAGTRGTIGVMDGDRMLAQTPLTIRVLP